MRVELPRPAAMLGLIAAAALALALALSAPRAHSEESPAPEMTDFRAQLENHDPPYESQVKTLLEGNKAEPRAGRIWITDARLTTFKTNGAVEIRALAPHCVFDSAEHTVSSAGPLQVKTADARFLLEGEGFLLRQTNSNLIISNRVHTLIVNASGKTPTP